MSEYTTNTGAQAQPHKPSMVENLKLKAEGLVDKVTGHNHAGTTTGTTGMGTHTGTGTHTGATGQQGYGGQQGYTGSNPEYAQQTPMGHHTGTAGTAGTTGQDGYGGQQGYPGTNPEYAHQTPTGYHTGTAGTTGDYGNQKPSMMDKVKAVISPGHQSDTVGAQHGTGTGRPSSSPAAPGATSLSTTDKIKNMLPGHHKTTGTGTGYGNQNTY